MIDTQVRPKSYARLMVLVALLGVASAVVTFVFMVLVNKGTGLIWQQAQLAVGLDSRLFTLLVCALGGLLVGLLVKIFGDHNAIFFELVQEFGKTGRFDYRHAPGIVITSHVSLISGASLGPEAALADACGAMGTWISDRRKLGDKETRTMGYGGLSAMLAAFITNPFAGALLALESSQGGASGAQLYAWGLLPSLLASAGATVVFVALAGGFFETLYAFPDYTPRLIDLVLAVPFSVAGGLAGLFFMLLFRWLRKVMLPLKGHLVLRGLIGGLGMGIIGALLPLTLFSGEKETAELILVIARSSRPHISRLARVPGVPGAYTALERHPENVPVPGVLILRLDSPMTYYNAVTIRDRLKTMIAAEQPPPRAVILDIAVQDQVDLTSAEVFRKFMKQMQDEGIAIYVAELHEPVAQLARRIEPGGIMGEGHRFPTVDAAVHLLEGNG
jgi:anti-anti-sigma regulatory factor